MKEIILQLAHYEIYIRLLCFLVIVLQIIQSLFASIQNYKKNKKNIQTHGEYTLKDDSSITEPEVWNENNLDTLSITEKLLQNIDIESDFLETTPNKIELMEKEQPEWVDIVTEQEPEVTVGETTSHQENFISPEIYNTNTNHEQINKQRSQFDYLKNEIELLKAKGLMVEYEKKLIEATIDFPDDYYFNNALWDRYMENEDYKKAHTLFKKLHAQNENDDKILFKLWLINLELNDLSTAEFLVTKAKDLKPENPRYYQVLAEIKYNAEKIDESIELMERAVDLRPTKFEYVEILGKLYKETDNIQLYYKTLLKMNALEPLNQRIKWELNKFQD